MGVVIGVVGFVVCVFFVDGAAFDTVDGPGQLVGLPVDLVGVFVLYCVGDVEGLAVVVCVNPSVSIPGPQTPKYAHCYECTYNP